MGPLPILSRSDQFPKHMSFAGGSAVKESACSEGELGSIPGQEDPPGEGKGNQLWYSCLGNPMDKRGYSPWSCRVGHNLLAKKQQG